MSRPQTVGEPPVEQTIANLLRMGLLLIGLILVGRDLEVRTAGAPTLSPAPLAATAAAPRLEVAPGPAGTSLPTRQPATTVPAPSPAPQPASSPPPSPAPQPASAPLPSPTRPPVVVTQIVPTRPTSTPIPAPTLAPTPRQTSAPPAPRSPTAAARPPTPPSPTATARPPAAPTPTPPPPDTQRRLIASVTVESNPLTDPEQTVYVTAKRSGAPVVGAQVRLVVTYPNGPQQLDVPPTGDDGRTELTWPVGQARGTIRVLANVSHQGEVATAQASFIKQ